MGAEGERAAGWPQGGSLGARRPRETSAANKASRTATGEVVADAGGEGRPRHGGGRTWRRAEVGPAAWVMRRSARTRPHTAEVRLYAAEVVGAAVEVAGGLYAGPAVRGGTPSCIVGDAGET